ncbi:hypothetical protein SAMD00019534_091370, partial [Acytostelium subglobosum LB1]|uniref:hypothetical protein n=1 Tax=Acytostelium subglobosum LB1 TaxID=1410327 RepID=UPI000644A504
IYNIMKMNISRTVLITGLLLLSYVVCYSSAIVIGIDVGAQSFKIGMVRPGAFEIVLNEQSQRKTPSQVGWFRDERVFGSDAANLWVRNPQQVYSMFDSLLGSTYQEDIVQQIGLGSLGYQVTNDTDRNTYRVTYDDESYYSPEELMAMILRKVRELANAYTQSTNIKDCVIAVPPWFTQQQRQAILDAAHLGGLNVLSLINNINAASLNFAMDRTFDKNQTAIFYDMGARSTKLSLVHYNVFNETKNKKNRTITNNIVKSIEWDETLGGLDFDMAIVNHFKQILLKQDPKIDTNDKKLTIKLLREATKVKETLSANQQAQAFIGSLVGDLDFSATLSRKEFQELSASLLERAVVPLKRLLEANGLTSNDIDFFELIGGSTRIPAVQDTLKAFLKRSTLDKHLNGDEAIANGAAFYAAGLTHYFRVKDIRLKDITPYTIDVKLVRSNQQEASQPILENEDNDNATPSAGDDQTGEEQSANAVSASASSFFRKNNRINIKKTLSFFSNQSFTLNVTYVDHTPANIAVYTVSGVPVPSAALNFTGKPKIHCSIRLNTNGMVVLEKAEAEITVYALKTKAIPSNSTANATATVDATNNATNANTTDTPTTQYTTELVSRVQRIPLNVTVQYQVVQPMSKEQLAAANTRINTLDGKDKALRDLRHEKNNLESFLYDTRDKLESEEYVECSTSEERASIVEELDIVSAWLSDAEDNGEDDIAHYQNKLKHLKTKTSKIVHRVTQKAEIPSKLEELENLLAKIKPTLANISVDFNITVEELKNATDKLEAIALWAKDRHAEYQVANFTKDLPFSTIEVQFKLFDLERLLKDLLKKKKRVTTPKPTKKPTTSSKDNKTAGEDETANNKDETTNNGGEQTEPETNTETNTESTNNNNQSDDQGSEDPSNNEEFENNKKSDGHKSDGHDE